MSDFVDDDYQLGAWPLLIPLVKGGFNVWRSWHQRRQLQQAMQQPQYAPAPQNQGVPVMRQQQPQQFLPPPPSGVQAASPRPFPGMAMRRRIRFRQSRDQMTGMPVTLAYDDFGNVVEVEPEQETPMMMGNSFGWDPNPWAGGALDDEWDDEFSGDDDDDEIDELGSDAWGDADELDNMASFGLDDDEFGAKEDRVAKKIQRLEAKLDKWEGKRASARTKMGRKRADRKIRNIKGKLSKAREKLTSARRTQKRSRRERGGLPPAVGGRAAAVASMGRGAQTPRGAQLSRAASTAAGLRATAITPYGEGNLLYIPMTQDSYTTPRNSMTVPVGLVSADLTLFGEDLSWMNYRIISFQTSVYGTDPTTAANAYVEDYKISGGTNLFPHEQPVGVQIYDVANDKFPGLRDNPTVKSPNKSQVTLHAEGDNGDVVCCECYTVADTILDDVYGPGVPGVYAGQ